MLHLLAAAAVAAPSPAAATQPAAPAASKIVFPSTRDGAIDLYAVAPDGRRIARITHGADVAEPELVVVSRDGTVAAYPRSDGKVDVVGTDGRLRGTISCRHATFGVSLSPSGRQVVCMTEYQTLSVVDVETGGARTVGMGFDPAWSPDGSAIAFVDETYRVSVVAAEGGQPRRLTRHRADFITELAWSPDSRRIAFADDSANLFVVAADGRGERLLARRADGPFSWSPNGTRIAAQDTRRRQIVVVDVRTGARRQLTHERAESVSPSWSPAGNRVVYLTGRRRADVEPSVFTIAADGSGRRRLTIPFRGGAIPRTSWVPGPLEHGILPPRVAVAHLAGGRQLALGGTVFRVVADGSRAATSTAFDCVSVIWNALTRRRGGMRTCSTEDVDTEPMYEIALSGSRFAWLQLCNCRYGSYNELHVKGPKESVGFGGAIDRNSGAGVRLRHLVGDRGLLAFNATVVTPSARGERELWIVPPPGAEAGACPAPGARICRRLRSGDGAEILDVDAGGILAKQDGGTLLLLSDEDRVLQRWSFRAGEVTGAQAAGRDVVVTTADDLRIYDAGSGALRRTVPLPRDVVTPRLLDAAAGFGAYVRGGAVHVVRLGDGRDVAIYAARQSEVVSGRLEPAGFFYLYNRLDARRPGRIAFVPIARLRRLVAKGG